MSLLLYSLLILLSVLSPFSFPSVHCVPSSSSYYPPSSPLSVDDYINEINDILSETNEEVMRREMRRMRERQIEAEDYWLQREMDREGGREGERERDIEYDHSLFYVTPSYVSSFSSSAVPSPSSPSSLPLSSPSPSPSLLSSPLTSSFNISSCPSSTLNVLCTPQEFSVQGVGIVYLPTDIVQLHFTVESSEELKNNVSDKNILLRDKELNTSEAQRFLQETVGKTRDKLTSILSFLRAEGTPLSSVIRQLSTSSVRVQPLYVWMDQSRLLRGYISSVSLFLRVPNIYVDELVMGLVERNVSSIDNVSFWASEERLLEAREEALKKASMDANKQAIIISTYSQSINMTEAEEGGRREPVLKQMNVLSLSIPLGQAEEGVGTMSRGYMAKSSMASDSLQLNVSPETNVPLTSLVGGMGIMGDTKIVSAVIQAKYIL